MRSVLIFHSVFLFWFFLFFFFLDLQSEKQKHYKNTLNWTENRFADYVAPEFECIVCIFQNLLRGVRKYLSLTSVSLILSFWKRWPVTCDPPEVAVVYLSCAFLLCLRSTINNSLSPHSFLLSYKPLLYSPHTIILRNSRLFKTLSHCLMPYVVMQPHFIKTKRL